VLKGAALKAHATALHARLKALYPDAHCALDYRNPYELAVATILSAQCTDKRVNIVTPDLFKRWPNAKALAHAKREDIEEVIQSTGFFRNKAKSLAGFAEHLVRDHSGEVPQTMEDLVVLPGIGRKTANVVLGNAFGINVGVVVDTHVQRLSNRLGLTKETDPVKVERALIPLFPQPEWTMLSHLLISHGRAVCDAKRPKCGSCTLADICPSAEIS
jgi:endonuclease-3